MDINSVTWNARRGQAVMAPAGELQGNPKARILVVDDEKVVARVLVDSLCMHRYAARAVHSAAAALGLLDNQEEFDLIISDLRLPDRDGSQLLQDLLRRQPAWQHRFIVITGDTTQATASGLSTCLGVACLPKPFRLPDLVRLVEHVLGHPALAAS